MTLKKELRRQREGLQHIVDFTNDVNIERMVYGDEGKPRGIIRRPDGSNLFLPKPEKEDES